MLALGAVIVVARHGRRLDVAHKLEIAEPRRSSLAKPKVLGEYEPKSASQKLQSTIGSPHTRYSA